jgi:hypothetical protein
VFAELERSLIRERVNMQWQQTLPVNEVFDRSGSKLESLKVSICFPLYLDNRTLSKSSSTSKPSAD